MAGENETQERPVSEQLGTILEGIDPPVAPEEEDGTDTATLVTTNAELIERAYSQKPFTKKEVAILSILCEQGECYGLELIGNSGGRLSRGSVHVHLSRMKDEGLITSRHEDNPREGMRPRKLYAVTEATKERFETWIKLLKILGKTVLQTD